MLQNRNKTTLSAASILLIFICGFLIAAAGAYFVDYIYDAEGFLDFTEQIVSFFILVAVLTVADFFSRRTGFSISGDKSVSNRQVNTIWYCLAGILGGLGVWTQMGESPKPSILWPMAVVVAVQIFLYYFASNLVFNSSDITRKKVWTHLLTVFVLIIPSVIIYSFVRLG